MLAAFATARARSWSFNVLAVGVIVLGASFVRFLFYRLEAQSGGESFCATAAVLPILATVVVSALFFSIAFWQGQVSFWARSTVRSVLRVVEMLVVSAGFAVSVHVFASWFA